MKKNSIQKKLDDLLVRLRKAWNADTSLEPERWTDKNPSIGQCAVSALIVQDEVGGEILRAEYPGGTHYWNRLPDGREVDMTVDQFNEEWGGRPPLYYKDTRTREYILSYPATSKRYEHLRACVDSLD